MTPNPCPECIRLRAIIAKALAVIARAAGGMVFNVKTILEEASK